MKNRELYHTGFLAYDRSRTLPSEGNCIKGELTPEAAALDALASAFYKMAERGDCTLYQKCIKPAVCTKPKNKESLPYCKELPVYEYYVSYGKYKPLVFFNIDGKQC